MWNGDSVVTVGTFDGLHLGHRKLIRRLVESGSPSTVVTFFPHPQMVVARPGKTVTLLSSSEEKVEGLSELGVQRLIVLHFDRELMNYSAEDFLRKIIIEKIGLRKMIMGYDHAFGRDRKGNKDFIVEQGKNLGFQTEIIEPHYCGGKIVSSTLVRKTLEAGNVRLAAEYLGRNYCFAGWVIKGEARGATLGFPTANLKLDSPYKALPLNGVYAAFALVGKKRLEALLYIGNKPTYGYGDLSIEVFLLNFSAALYGEQLKVEIVERLRGDIKFGSAAELVKQMKQDETEAREIFKNEY